MTLADFFSSEAWLAIRDAMLAFAAVFWLSVGFWVWRDARRRTEEPWLVALATVLGLVPPFLGALVYLLFRPPEYLDEVRERQLEIRAIEQHLRGRDLRCPGCRSEVDPSFLVCPACATRLKQACPSCKAPLEPAWRVCPYCETPLAQPAE